MNGQRPWWKTVVGIVLTAIMLFPVYWMINVSLTPTERDAARPAEPVPVRTRPSRGTRRCSASSCRTSARASSIGLGTVVLTVALVGAGRLLAGEAAAARAAARSTSCC